VKTGKRLCSVALGRTLHESMEHASTPHAREFGDDSNPFRRHAIETKRGFVLVLLGHLDTVLGLSNANKMPWAPRPTGRLLGPGVLDINLDSVMALACPHTLRERSHLARHSALNSDDRGRPSPFSRGITERLAWGVRRLLFSARARTRLQDPPKGVGQYHV